ncbi:MAG: hypothetical protein KF735_03130 [Chelatococcus sp.]|uniref:hypothetical protein n=1 Tax=Chelatococcus sp. TaxID=1953771 RepID=UPI0025BB2CFE|nr:hypothetical protein [Chelatococcus sp.]MBX3536608.1 hypothetical protein [Chelatococcus sp.]
MPLRHLSPLWHLLTLHIRSRALGPARPSARRPLAALGALAAFRPLPLRTAILIARVGRALRNPQPRSVWRHARQAMLCRVHGWGHERGVEGRSRHA